MDDCRWIVCFDTAMIIRNVYSTNEENANSSVKYYRSIYPHVKIMDEQQLNKMESWLSGLRRTTGNRVYVDSVPRVQIPNSPPFGATRF